MDDLCKCLHKHDYIVYIINWQARHNDYIGKLLLFYDFVMSALDGINILVDIYVVPHEKIIALSHDEMDIRVLIDQKGGRRIRQIRRLWCGQLPTIRRFGHFWGAEAPFGGSARGEFR
jgi:hypothetical protein